MLLALALSRDNPAPESNRADHQCERQAANWLHDGPSHGFGVAAGASPAPASAYPMFKGPASICFTDEKGV